MVTKLPVMLSFSIKMFQTKFTLGLENCCLLEFTLFYVINNAEKVANKTPNVIKVVHSSLDLLFSVRTR